MLFYIILCTSFFFSLLRSKRNLKLTFFCSVNLSYNFAFNVLMENGKMYEKKDRWMIYGWPFLYCMINYVIYLCRLL